MVWDETREKAIARMIFAIDNYQVSGVKTNLDFCKYVLKHKAFTSGDFDTNFIKHYFETPELVNTAMLEEKKALESAVEILWKDLKEKNEREFISKPIHGAWKLMVK